MDNDRRAFKRFAQTLKVSYTVLSGIGATPFEYGVAETVDISRSGLKIVVEEEIAAPMLVQLNITVPTRAYGLFVLGKAVYCTPREEPETGFDVGQALFGTSRRHPGRRLGSGLVGLCAALR